MNAAKQEQAAKIVADSGIDPKTFNAIGSAMQSDPAVAKRVQLAAADMQGRRPARGLRALARHFSFTPASKSGLRRRQPRGPLCVCQANQ